MLEGVLDIGGQEHFYLESQAAIAVPGEQGQMTVHSSTQHPSEVQMMVAEVLGVPFNHVVCVCKRMGGGFGGKETQAAQPAMMAALVAAHTRRPVRFVYGKDDDMRFTGKRHPFKACYKVGFDDDGRITRAGRASSSPTAAARPTCRSPCWSGRCCTRDNAYFLPERPRHRPRLPDEPPEQHRLPRLRRAAGRGGHRERHRGDRGDARQVDALDVRQANCYGVDDRNVTPYGQVVAQQHAAASCSPRSAGDCDYDARRAEIERSTTTRRRTCKGLALTAVKFGISFTRRTINQANALVNVYLDGTVIVSTGATEMGQGVNTRVRQIVADELGVRVRRA